ncbi:hypothetical protein HDU97_008534 [Phlyctochytrium planicorne]|nr:hypothetical protein HDU97_008534 [Phlyctochytrium planicorne]
MLIAIPPCAKTCLVNHNLTVPDSVDSETVLLLCNQNMTIDQKVIRECVAADPYCLNEASNLLNMYMSLQSDCKALKSPKEDSWKPKVPASIIAAIICIVILLLLALAGIAYVLVVRSRRQKNPSREPTQPSHSTPNEEDFLVTYAPVGAASTVEPTSQLKPTIRKPSSLFEDRARVMGSLRFESEDFGRSSEVAKTETSTRHDGPVTPTSPNSPPQLPQEKQLQEYRAPARTASLGVTISFQQSSEKYQPAAFVESPTAPARTTSRSGPQADITSWDTAAVAVALANAGVKASVLELLQAHRTDGLELLELDHARLMSMGILDGGARHVVLTAVGVVRDLYGADLPPPKYS